jgi:hypothetical protein
MLMNLGQRDEPSSKERARITDIMIRSLNELYVEQKEALDKGKKARAIEIGFEIEELRREMETIKECTNV